MLIIPSNEYITRFEKLIDTPDISDKEILLEIRQLIFQAPIAFHELPLQFVVRTSPLAEDEICTNISRCYYNTDTKKIPLQRCNYKEQQVFYASVPGGMKNMHDGAMPSLMETTFQKVKDDPKFNGRLIVATRWILKKNPFVWTLPFHVSSIENNENFRFMKNQFSNVIGNNYQTSELKNFNEKLRYLSELFCRNDKRNMLYRISSTCYNEVMNHAIDLIGQSFDGLVYPSANTHGEGMNIVLKKEFVDQYAYCDTAVLYGLVRDPNNQKSIDFPILAEAWPDQNGDLKFYKYGGN